MTGRGKTGSWETGGVTDGIGDGASSVPERSERVGLSAKRGNDGGVVGLAGLFEGRDDKGLVQAAENQSGNQTGVGDPARIAGSAYNRRHAQCGQSREERAMIFPPVIVRKLSEGVPH